MKKVTPSLSRFAQGKLLFLTVKEERMSRKEAYLCYRTKEVILENLEDGSYQKL